VSHFSNLQEVHLTPLSETRRSLSCFKYCRSIHMNSKYFPLNSILMSLLSSVFDKASKNFKVWTIFYIPWTENTNYDMCVTRCAHIIFLHLNAQ